MDFGELDQVTNFAEFAANKLAKKTKARL